MTYNIDLTVRRRQMLLKIKDGKCVVDIGTGTGRALVDTMFQIMYTQMGYDKETKRQIYRASKLLFTRPFDMEFAIEEEE